mmetsp:Transcript_11250/g.17353  ORF Transcript_11250/g.17353 Transcript_11250/m.17353 type:complete len:95 (-) Transcript_11250:209-493(-)
MPDCNQFTPSAAEKFCDVLLQIKKCIHLQHSFMAVAREGGQKPSKRGCGEESIGISGLLVRKQKKTTWEEEWGFQGYPNNVYPTTTQSSLGKQV